MRRMARPLTRPRSPTRTRRRRSLASRRSRLSPVSPVSADQAQQAEGHDLQAAGSGRAFRRCGEDARENRFHDRCHRDCRPLRGKRQSINLSPVPSAFDSPSVGISASMVNTDRLCRAISTRPFLPRLHPLCSALRHPVLRGYPSYSVTPLINPLGSIVLPRILVAVSPFRRVPFLRVSFRCILFRLPPPRRHPLIWYTGTLRVQIAVIHNCMCEMVVFGL